MNIQKKSIPVVFLFCCLMAFMACEPPANDVFDDTQPPQEEGNFEPGTGEIGPDGHPLGWTKETHGKKADLNYDLLFGHSNTEVLRMDLVIAPSDWQAMLDDLTEKLGPFGTSNYSPDSMNEENPWDLLGGINPIYVPCDVVFKGITWYHVGVRFKGNSSLTTSWAKGSYKIAMRFNFDKFEDDYPEIKNQRFYGFDKLALASNNLDNSMIREKIGGDIYRDMGIPVAKTSFCRVFVDYGQGKKYFGLYTLQEIPAKPMLKTEFLDDDGNLYKPDGLGASFATWDQVAFDKETNEDEADFSDVLELFNTLQSDRTNEAAFKARLESIFDVDGFMRYLAVNHVISNWDTYGRIAHNYYLYHDPGDNMIHWIPWDFTAALVPSADASIPPISLDVRFFEVGERWPLIRFLIDVPEYRAKYVDYVEKTINECFYPDRMNAIISQTKALVYPYVIGEYGEVNGYTNLEFQSDFKDAFEVFGKHFETRYNAARRFVNRNQ